ncbi:MAG: hypothetical protein R3Y11_12670, partial [Pseudomonadota bacterium]
PQTPIPFLNFLIAMVSLPSYVVRGARRAFFIGKGGSSVLWLRLEVCGNGQYQTEDAKKALNLR